MPKRTRRANAGRARLRTNVTRLGGVHARQHGLQHHALEVAQQSSRVRLTETLARKARAGAETPVKTDRLAPSSPTTPSDIGMKGRTEGSMRRGCSRTQGRGLQAAPGAAVARTPSLPRRSWRDRTLRSGILGSMNRIHVRKIAPSELVMQKEVASAGCLACGSQNLLFRSPRQGQPLQTARGQETRSSADAPRQGMYSS